MGIMVPYYTRIYYALFGPRLNRLHKDRNGFPAVYVENSWEKCGNFVIQWMKTFYNIGYSISPFLVYMVWRKQMINQEGFLFFFKYGLSVAILLTAATCFRATGRLINRDYQRLTAALYLARNGNSNVDIRAFDFDMSWWPVDFYIKEGPRGDPNTPPLRFASVVEPHRSLILKFLYLPWDFLCYVVAHSFGIRLLYPGTLSFIQNALHQTLTQARAKLVEETRGRRAKLRTIAGFDVDTMFVDRRTETEEGQYLVVCCEGNAGFYEIGSMSTPLSCDYSVLGWNHPGFAGSNGMPYPPREQQAIDAVMQYATFRLNFPQDKIIVFAWSIGGYTASYAAMNYPNLKAVILDATFDHVLPLAKERMPKVIHAITKDTITHHANLNNSDQLKRYNGPVMFVRRTRDEMICTRTDPIDISTNRSNVLALKTLTHRYPLIMTPETESALSVYLSLESKSLRDDFYRDTMVDDAACKSLLQAHVDALSVEDSIFPCRLQPDSPDDAIRLGLYLLTKHLLDFEASHCTPLPIRFFQLPWELKRSW